MGIGARDYIDKLLVDKYSQQKVDNHDDDALVSKVDAEDMLSAMNIAGRHSMNMMLLNSKLSVACYGVVAKNARYSPLEEYVA